MTEQHTPPAEDWASTATPFFSPSALSLRRVFQQAFVVHDIAEALISFDDSTDASKVREFMKARRLEIVGVRRDGRVHGFVERADLNEGPCGAAMRCFDDSHIVLDSTPLADLVIRLKEHRRLFVSLLGHVGGIVSRSDLHKPPVRMWLFGMVTLIEMRFGRLIEQFCPHDSWRQFLSEGRIYKAKSLLAERRRRNQDLKLLDCLQLADKARIIARDDRLRGMTRFESKRQMETAAKMLETLRNNLVHSQDIVTTEWETIVFLSENLDNVLDGPPGMQEATRHNAAPNRSK